MNRTILLTTLLVLAACSEEETAAGARLLAPDAVDVEWDAHFNGTDDRLGVLVPVDVLVYDGATGEPLADAALTVGSTEGATLLEVDAVGFAAYDCEDCVWDAGRDRYVVLPANAENEDLSLSTDPDGLARIYVWIDALPADARLAFDLEVTSDEGTFEILGH